MKTKADNLLERIHLGEDSFLELKTVTVPGKRVVEPDSRDIADEFAAAANTQGATFVFGVSDLTRQLVGIDFAKLDIVETWVRDVCNDSIKPPLLATIRKQSLVDSNGEPKSVICVDIPKSLFVHESPHGYFYRIGSSKRKMSPELLARLFQQRSQTRMICFDEQTVSTATPDILNRDLYTRFKTPLSPAVDVDFLRKLHFIAPDDAGTVRPTVGGILMACEHPERHLPSAYIQAVCYRGTDRNADDQLDAKDIFGPIDHQVIEACAFVNRNMRIAAVKTPARIDIPQYAMNAVFEAVVNAVAHRDYSISGAKIRLHMFADRLEIFSPGGLPNSLTLDEIGERQFSRNELICTCLSRCPLVEKFTDLNRSRMMDRRGEGVPVILSASTRLAQKQPKYEILNDSEVKLTIYSVSLANRSQLRKIAEQLSSPPSETLQTFTEPTILAKIKELIRANPKITQTQMAKVCGVSRTSIATWIKKSNGTIRHIGFDNGGFWQLAD